MPATVAKQDDSALTGRAGLVYLFDGVIAPYASYSTSFEPLAGVAASGEPFKPTKAEQYEIGIKYEPKDWPGLVTLGAFDITQRNLRTAVTDQPGKYDQLGEVRTRGVELEVRLSPLPGLNLIGAYTYQDAEIAKDKPASTGGASAEGKTPYMVPTHLASLWGDYRIQDGALAGLGFGAGVRYVGATWADTQNTVKVPDYVLVDAALSYDLGRLAPRLEGVDATFNVKNLFDEKYVSGCAGRLTSCYWGYGRTALLTLSYRW
jgi:iron complex outermembrane receptor protein